MTYFPFFVNLEGQSGLIIGGGRVALNKAKRLLDYGPRLTIVAPVTLPEFETLPGITVIHRKFDRRDLDGAPAFVVAATNNREINHMVALLCRERRIPVNVVDTPEDCTFLFPALVRCGCLSVGVSTGGASPSAAAYFKEKIEEIFPQNIEEILDWLQVEREIGKRNIENVEARKDVFQSLFLESIRLGRPLQEEETEALIGRILKQRQSQR